MAATAPRRFALARRLACPAVTGLAIGLLVHHMDLGRAVRQLSTADVRWLALGSVLTLMSSVLGAVCWGVIARGVGIRLGWEAIAVWSGRAVVAGQLVPGGAGGDAVRVVAGRRVGATVGTSLGADLVARACGAVAMTAWGASAALLLHDAVGPMVVAVALSLLLVAVTGLAVLLDGDLLIRPLARRHGAAATAVSGRLAPATAALAELRRHPAPVFQALLLSAAGWGLNLTALVCMGRAVNAVVGWQVFAVVIPVSLVATLTPLAANGVGLREGILVGLLARAGVAASPALALSLLVDLQLVPVAVLGALMGLRHPAEADPATVAPSAPLGTPSLSLPAQAVTEG